MTDPEFNPYAREPYRLDTFNRPETCSRAGHVRGCAGEAGGDHELREGWIGYEDQDGQWIEVEIAS